MGTNSSSWHKGTIPFVTSRGASNSRLISATQEGQDVLVVPAGSTHSPIGAKDFAPVGLPSCSKDFNALKCNLNTFKAKQALVTVMLLRLSSSEPQPVFPVSPVAQHPTGKLGMGPAAFSLEPAKRDSVPAAGGMLWQLSLRRVPGPRSAEGPLLTGGPTSPQGTLPHAQGLRVSRLQAAFRQLPQPQGPPSHVAATQGSQGWGRSPGSS